MNVSKYCMIRVTVLLVISLILLKAPASGQVNDRKNYFPIWTYHQRNINIHGVSIGLGTSMAEPRFTNTNGIKIELIGLGFLIGLIPQSPVAVNDSLFIALLDEPISENINGLNLSATGTFCNCITNGVHLGSVGSYNYQVNGINGTIFMNLTQIINGFQFSVYNESFFLNGVQVGLINKSKHTSGLQIGIYNKSKSLKGFQFGIWNINEKRKLPLINWNFDN